MNIGTLSAAGLLLVGAAAHAASGGGHDDHGDHAKPVPTGAELVERCDAYRESLTFSRKQMRERNILGRWEFFRARHRERERFYADHCVDEATHAANAHGDEHHADTGAHH